MNDEKKAKAEVERLTRDLAEVAAARERLTFERKKLDDELTKVSPSDESAIGKFLERQRGLADREQLLARRGELALASLNRARADLDAAVAAARETEAIGLRAKLREAEGEARDAAEAAEEQLASRIRKVQGLAAELGRLENEIAAARGTQPDGFPTSSVWAAINIDASALAGAAGALQREDQVSWARSLSEKSA